MIYFKKITLYEYSQTELEAAFRKASMKSTSSFGLSGSTTNAGTKYSFVGYEGKNELLFTRIKYFIEKYLPQIIIKVSRDPNESSYQLKFSGMTSGVFMFISLITLLMLFTMVREPERAGDVLPTFMIPVGFILLVLLEIRLTERQINKILRKYREILVTPSAYSK